MCPDELMKIRTFLALELPQTVRNKLSAHTELISGYDKMCDHMNSVKISIVSIRRLIQTEKELYLGGYIRNDYSTGYELGS